MYRVVIIDDEGIIVEGLKRVVDWQAFGCSVVATAKDAFTGVLAIREHSPDLLFTDIRMPDKDGLTMLAGIKSEFPDMQVTILTGYRDFEYAQTAVRLGVTRLLLKPSRMDEIQEAIIAMIEELRKRNNMEENEHENQLTQSANSFIVRQAIAYMDKNFPNKITLTDVADHCYVSQWHLSKLLNKHTGKNFYELLNSVRIKAAKQMLLDPKLKISQICEMVGYTDTGHFSRVFKKLEGISANAYRNTYSGI